MDLISIKLWACFAGVAIFTKKQHRRSPSHFNLKYGRENSPPSSPVKEAVLHISSENETRDGLEVTNISIHILMEFKLF